MRNSKIFRIGLVGYGYWGPNIARNFSTIQDVQVVKICDLDTQLLEQARRTYGHIQATRNYIDITTDCDINGVAIATPVSSHFDIAKSALCEGKHVFVEKPFTLNSAQAEELIDLAEKKNLTIMVDHTFLFTGSVRKIKELITEQNVLGDIFYYDSTRINLGLFQHDVNVAWDLAAHDFSIMDYVIDKKPAALTASGSAHFREEFEDIAYITIYFDNCLIAHFNLNWLSPVKIRSTLIGGKKKMLVWNDLEADEKIKIYDKGVNVENREGIYNSLVEYRSGDVLIPKVDHTEALKTECQYFVDCILNDKKPINDGQSGLRIVRMLEAVDQSLKSMGKLVRV
jgi:predicted dehydrogenase